MAIEAETSAKSVLNGVEWRANGDFSPENYEKIWGKSNLLSIGYLHQGLTLSQAVARIVITFGGRTSPLGTGFLIAPDLLMTNNHVIPDAADADECAMEFNYQKTWDGRMAPARRYRFDAKRFRTNKDLDYTIIGVDGAPGELYGHVDLGKRRDPEVGENVAIIQHPQGRPKEIAMMDNWVGAVFGSYAQYTTDTEPGSSGSPVFDTFWNIVALHHAGGTLPREDGSRWFINQGILMSRILRDAWDFLGLPDTLFDTAFGEMKPEMLRIAAASPEPTTLRRAARDLAHRHPRFLFALNDWVDVNRDLVQRQKGITIPDTEALPALAAVGPLLAAIAGTAIGAAIRHWAMRSGHGVNPQANQPAANAAPAPTNELIGIVSRSTEEARPPIEVYKSVLESVAKDPDSVKNLADVGQQEALPILVLAFLAGVAAGARAYDGRI